MAANAQTVIDFDAAGFDIDNVPLVTFSGAQVETHGGITGLSGTQGFGWISTGDILATFDSSLLVTAVSFNAARSIGNSPGVIITAYASDDSILASDSWLGGVSSDDPNAQFRVLSLNVTGNYISYVTISRVTNLQTEGNIFLDDFTYFATAVPGPDPVPEPFTMGLAAAALGAAWRKRRRR
ncbi:MAG: hypothetical protein SNJ74_00665 [Fimbriimonadaceae bacterium]